MNNSEQVLRSLLPMLLVLIVLIVGVVVMPTITADPRSRASEPKKVIVTPSAIITPKTKAPEIACSDLYSPVCDPATNTTYSNACEAGLAKVIKTIAGECQKPSQISLPISN